MSITQPFPQISLSVIDSPHPFPGFIFGVVDALDPSSAMVRALSIIEML
jgi:hypothetical protein